MAKQHYILQERARVRVRPEVSLLDLMKALLEAIPQGFLRRPSRMRFRIPREYREQLLDELEPSYRNSYIGDLSEVFRRCADLYWGMTYAGIDVHLDDALDAVIVLDTPTSLGHEALKMPEPIPA